MLALLLAAIFAELAQPGVISQVPTVLFAKTERIYKASADNVLGQLFISMFRIGVLALLLQLCFYNGGTFEYLDYALLMGVVLAFILVKMVMNVLIDYTFQLTRHFASPYEQYGAIATTVCLLLFPCLLVLIRIGNAMAARWVLGGSMVLFLGLMLFRWFRTFVHEPVALLYILLYILTLEVVPMAALLWISHFLLN